MDPNANLAEQERIVVGIYAGGNRRGDMARLRELREALAAWLRGGGCEPDWYQAPRAVAYFAARGLVKLERQG